MGRRKVRNIFRVMATVILLLFVLNMPAWALDSDADGIDDLADNCPTVSNAEQLDTNNDGVGDACTVYHCVSNSVEFQNSLNEARSNNFLDVIQLQQGIYKVTENNNSSFFKKSFFFDSTDGFGIKILGGYNEDCESLRDEPDKTILDGENLYTVLVIKNGYERWAHGNGLTIEGVTIQRGKASDSDFGDAEGDTSAGLYISNITGEINIKNNIIKDNSIAATICGHSGAGIRAENISGDIIMTDNLIIHNISARCGIGGGVSLATTGSGTIDVNNNKINNNYAPDGGGLYAEPGFMGKIKLSGNIVTGNSASQQDSAGGGIFIKDKLYANKIEAILTNNIIANNSASAGLGVNGTGGGLVVIANKITLANNTITKNITTGTVQNGGGVFLLLVSPSGIADIYNNIIWGNTGTYGGDIYLRTESAGSAFNVFFNDFGASKLYGTPTTQGENMDIDPLFAEAVNGDYHLTAASPVRDRASIAAPYFPVTDFEADPRVLESAPDIGADEFSPVRTSFSAAPLVGMAPLNVNFTDTSSSSSGSVVLWAWDFNNDGIIDSNIQHPSFVFSTPGKYTVTLTATDAHGNRAVITKTAYIVAGDTTDQDQDGIYDYLDNCSNTYNPLQTDLNKDGIGDACQPPVDLIDQVTLLTSLKSATAADAGAIDKTAIMNDNELTNGITVQVANGKSYVVSFRAPMEARSIAGITLKVYVSSLYNNLPQNSLVYPYDSSGTAVQSTKSSQFILSQGWNTLDLTPILHSMDGFGFCKFRVTVPRNWLIITEASISVTIDSVKVSTLPALLDFGSIEAGALSSMLLSVTNSGASGLKIEKVVPPSFPFTIKSDGCSGLTLSTSATCPVSVEFSPRAITNFTGVVKVLSSDADIPSLKVALKGAGVQPTNSLNGIVSDVSTNLPLANVAVTVTDLLAPHTASTDASGAYVVNGLALGDFSAIFDKNWYLKQTLTGTIRTGSQLLSTQLTPYPPLVLTITSPQEGAAYTVPSAAVSGTVSNNAQVMVNGVPAQVVNNAFSQLVSLVEGNNTITVIAYDQYAQTTTQTISVSYVTSGTLSGRVTNAITGQAIAGTTVTITDSSGAVFVIASNSAGDYSIANVKMGNYTGNVSAPDYRNRSISGTMFPAQTVTADWTLTSLATTISAISASDVTANSAVVIWTTDQPATSLVEYGETMAYGNFVSDAVLATSHGVALSALKAGTTYHFRVTSINGEGYTSSSGDTTFTTPVFSAKTLGQYGNVAVMAVSGNYDGRKADDALNALPRQEIAKEFYRTHGDTYDFMVAFSDFPYAMAEEGAKGFYIDVKNDTPGLGLTLFDNTASFGSGGYLQGFIDMGDVSALAANIYGPKLDETLTTLTHELMHRWGAYVRFKNADGTLNSSLLGKDSAHWSYLLDSKGSIMYGNGWQDNGNGSFTATAAMSGYSPLDLYLMGMIPKEQVPPMLLIDNPSIDKTQLPHLGDTITGTAKTVTINDIVDAEGERVPNAADSQKQFNVGFVLLTRAGDNAIAATQAIETLRKAWAGRFAELTHGTGTVANIPASLVIAVDSPADGVTITGPDVTVSGSFINTSGVETGITVNGSPATVSGNRFIANHVPLQEGSNTLTIMGTDANGLTATTNRSVTAQAGHYIRIISNIESGTAPLNISLRLDGSFSIANPQISVTGPVAVTLTPGATTGEYTATLTVEGTYTFTASAIGPDGQTYSDTVTVPVMSKTAIDGLLRGKWNKVNSALVSGDATTALNAISSRARPNYQAIFTELAGQLASIISTHQEFSLISVSQHRAEYELITLENGSTYSYEVVFVKEDNGLWALHEY